MRRPSEKPVREDTPDRTLGTHKITHPAFAVISASRVQGDTNLFQSEIKHDGFVVIRIGSAVLQEGSHYDHTYGNNTPYIEVALSESQWVAFVSRMNIGSGVPCTLTDRMDSNGRLIQVPAIDFSESAADKLARKASELSESHETHIQEAVKTIEEIGASLPKGKRMQLDSALIKLTNAVGPNIRYAHQTLRERAEDLVMKAKVEIDAMINSRITQLGLKALQDLGTGGLIGHDKTPKDK